MKVYFYRDLPASERAWEASNGATRRTLVVVNKTGRELSAGYPIDARLGTLNKGNHSFVFVNPGRPGDERVVGVLTSTAYGVRLHSGVEVFKAVSTGGPGNSESTLGIYEAGSVLALDTYKSRNGEIFVRLDPDKGWVEVPLEEMFFGEATEIG